MCDVWQLSDVVMCTSSIMHMCNISLDRYTAISDPLGSRAARSRLLTAFWAKIGAVWLASVVIASPLIVLGILSPGDLLSDDGQCAIVNANFLIYGSLAAFFGPLTIMLVTFVLTVRLLEKEATQLAADGPGGMRRCTAERKAVYATPPPATTRRLTAGTSADSAGRRRRSARTSWMSRISRSEAPTTTSMLPSPSKIAPPPITTSGRPVTTFDRPDTTSGRPHVVVVGDIPHPIDGGASRETSRAVGEAETAAGQRAMTSSTGARRDDEFGPTEADSCAAADVSTSAAHASSTFDDVTNTTSNASSEIARQAVSAHDVTRVAPSTDEQRKSTVLVKSVSELGALRRLEVVFQRRSVTVTSSVAMTTSLDSSSGKMADRLRRMMVSLHPGHAADAERYCLLERPVRTRRYDDSAKPLPAENDTRCLYDRGVLTVSGPAAAMRRSRSDSAVESRPPTRYVVESRDHDADEGGSACDVISADAERPLAPDTANVSVDKDAVADDIVADVVDGNHIGSISNSPSGADRFKGLVRKHGAAFHVAGMLNATRDDRQQKAFNSVKTESKAVKVLGTMFAIFVTCWTPFFAVNLMMGICTSCYVNPVLFKVRRYRLSPLSRAALQLGVCEKPKFGCNSVFK